MDEDSRESFLLLLISAPSGAGKTTLMRMMLANHTDLAQSVSVTTRPMRSSEVNGVDYRFVSVEEYKSMKLNGDFLESAEVHGHNYGTSHAHLNDILLQRKNAIAVIDWQGVRAIKENVKNKYKHWSVVSVFIVPPSMRELRRRLIMRSKDDDASVALRLSNANEEILRYNEYDHVIINDNLILAFKELSAIYKVGIVRCGMRLSTSIVIRHLLEECGGEN